MSNYKEGTLGAEIEAEVAKYYNENDARGRRLVRIIALMEKFKWTQVCEEIEKLQLENERGEVV
jgi:excinuclease UvrABC nuclease subunit